MTSMLGQVQKGWRVYAVAAAIGRVEALTADELVVTSGLLVRHRYRIPAAYVARAANGAVDLRIGPATVADLQGGH